MPGSGYGFARAQLRDHPTVFADRLFSGKVVMVTGAGGGLGLAIAILFARLGADLAINGRNPDKLEDAAAFLRGFGGQVLARPMTIRDPGQVQDFVDAVGTHFGGLDILVNNAGGQFPQPALDYTPKGWNAVIDTNLNGTWWMMQAAARNWVKAGRPGAIVSIVADIWRGMPGIAHSCAARAGVIYLSKSIAVEWAPHEIRVNAVCPTFVETPLTKVMFENEAIKTDILGRTPLGRLATPQEVAAAIVFLASPQAGMITGTALAIDGGWTAI